VPEVVPSRVCTVGAVAVFVSTIGAGAVVVRVRAVEVPATLAAMAAAAMAGAAMVGAAGYGAAARYEVEPAAGAVIACIGAAIEYAGFPTGKSAEAPIIGYVAAEEAVAIPAGAAEAVAIPAGAVI